jgi:hypothetical protein
MHSRLIPSLPEDVFATGFHNPAADMIALLQKTLVTHARRRVGKVKVGGLAKFALDFMGRSPCGYLGPHALEWIGFQLVPTGLLPESAGLPVFAQTRRGIGRQVIAGVEAVYNPHPPRKLAGPPRKLAGPPCPIQAAPSPKATPSWVW